MEMHDRKKRCLIITGGKIERDFALDFLRSRTYDYVIGADAGLRMMKEAGLHPDKLVGDFDTVDPSYVDYFRRDGDILFDIHKPEKDETDTELALRDAESAGCREVDILGALGGRIDHELANIQLLLLYKKRGILVTLYDRQNRIHVAVSGETFSREKAYGKYISFIPMTPEVKEVTLKGFKYPLTRRLVTMGSSLCVSNEIAAESAKISFREGELLCVEAHD